MCMVTRNLSPGILEPSPMNCCALCGAMPIVGWPSIAFLGPNKVWLCHPDGGGGQDCFKLWVVYGHRPPVELQKAS